MQPVTLAARRHGRQPDAGYSIVEVLIAGAIMLFIALSILPIFAQSISSNLSGQDSTSVANHARSRVEELYQLPFDTPFLQLTDGDERRHDEYYSRNQKAWLPGTEDDVPVGDEALWTRVTQIRNYSATDIETPLAFNSDPTLVHLKELLVTVAATREGGPLGGGKRIIVQAFKSS
ncbi:MAG TPA: hypothetical protein VMT16_04890 [Thermoanaerobaculia bacterium]|nr:hypothetical protein [Thermoanaerobaculia bacterium]